MGVVIRDNIRPIHATSNGKEAVHRWSPYIQGFAASFVRDTITGLQNGRELCVLDPFVGSGTVAIQARKMGVKSCGVEFNPLLHFVANTKAEGWHADPDLLRNSAKQVVACRKRASAPDFLANDMHFNDDVLAELEALKSGVESLPSDSTKTRRVRDLLRLSLSSILIECSQLVRSPCLTRRPEKRVEPEKVRALFNTRVNHIAEDIEELRVARRGRARPASCHIIPKNSITYEHDRAYDLVITSPPYMNGMDYVINYKIEMSWLDFADSQRGLKRIKDNMVACDNVSRGMVRNFSKSSPPPNKWADEISARVADSIAQREFYRRRDMPDIMRKYFSDMRSVMHHTIAAVRPGGKIVMVVGDSLMAGVYVPTDLILAKMGKDEGLKIESVEKARNRRSGQQRDYKLRETVITLIKP